MLDTVSKSFPYKLVLKSMLVVLIGLLLTILMLHFSFYKEHGNSYAESYKLFSNLKNELLRKSVFIYLSSSLLIVVGVAVISLLYSHRVAGPLYRLEMFARRVASGDLTQIVRLRQSDVIHPMADDLNSIVSSLKETVAEIESGTEELKEAAAGLHADSGKDFADALESMSEKTEEIKDILLSRIRL